MRKAIKRFQADYYNYITSVDGMIVYETNERADRLFKRRNERLLARQRMNS